MYNTRGINVNFELTLFGNNKSEENNNYITNDITRIKEFEICIWYFKNRLIYISIQPTYLR